MSGTGCSAELELALTSDDFLVLKLHVICMEGWGVSTYSPRVSRCLLGTTFWGGGAERDAQQIALQVSWGFFM